MWRTSALNLVPDGVCYIASVYRSRKHKHRFRSKLSQTPSGSLVNAIPSGKAHIKSYTPWKRVVLVSRDPASEFLLVPSYLIAVCNAFRKSDFAGTQLDYIATEVLTETGVFTDYTDTDGVWQTEKESGDTIDQTVWTRYIQAVRLLRGTGKFTSCDSLRAVFIPPWQYLLHAQTTPSNVCVLFGEAWRVRSHLCSVVAQFLIRRYCHFICNCSPYVFSTPHAWLLASSYD